MHYIISCCLHVSVGFLWSSHVISTRIWEYDYSWNYQRTWRGLQSGRLACLPNKPEWYTEHLNFSTSDIKVSNSRPIKPQHGMHCIWSSELFVSSNFLQLVSMTTCLDPSRWRMCHITISQRT